MRCRRPGSMYAFSNRQLAELLRIAANRGSDPPLPVLFRSREEVEAELVEVGRGLKVAGDLLLAAVLGRDTPLAVLVRVKRTAKRLYSLAAGTRRRAAIAILYHAAIAAAASRYATNISRRPMQERIAVYEDLAAAFSKDRLGDLFREAVDWIA